MTLYFKTMWSPGGERGVQRDICRAKKEIWACASWCICVKPELPLPLSYKHCGFLSLSHSFTYTNSTCVSPQTPYPRLPCQICCCSIPNTRIMAALLFRFMTQNLGKEHAVLMSEAQLWPSSQIFTNAFLSSALGSFWLRHTLSWWFPFSLLSYRTLSILSSSVYSSSIM